MFERCLYFNINALTRAVNRVWDNAFAEYGLSPAHAYCLRLVLSSPGISPKQISDELKLEKSTVTRFINALADKGLVTRKKGATSDAREQSIMPTAKAGRMARKLERTGDALYQKMTDALGKNNMTALVKQLRDAEQNIS